MNTQTITIILPNNAAGRYLINLIIEKIACAVGDIDHTKSYMEIPITCRKSDYLKVENILRSYGA